MNPEAPSKPAALRRVLLVAYHFAPMAGSSGVQRALRFAQYLPSQGWQPLVLTIDPRAYERTDDSLTASLPADLVVRRAFGLDTARHLSIAGRYIAAMARPDRWQTWRFDGVRQGMRLIQDYQPEVIWSTFPIPTAHRIASSLQQRSGLPWVADFRDPMAQDGYPADPVTWRQFKAIETDTLARARLVTFTTPGAAADYRLRYPASADRIRVLENGFDEGSFAQVDAQARAALNCGAFTLLHSGVAYPEERDPTALMQALRLLHDAGTIRPGQLRIRFRASGFDGHLQRLADQAGVGTYIETSPPIPYREALHEMLCADALLLMQASNCNAQIPAKTYEYLRAGRPILCLSDPIGDTVGVLRQAGLNDFARLDDAQDIAAAIARMLQTAHTGALRLPLPGVVQAASRQGRTQALAALLTEAAR